MSFFESPTNFLEIAQLETEKNTSNEDNEFSEGRMSRI